MQPLSPGEIALLRRLSSDGHIFHYFDVANAGGSHETLISRNYAFQGGGALVLREAGYKALSAVLDAESTSNSGAKGGAQT